MWRDDERLLDALAEAVRTGAEVPPDYVEAGKAAFAWRTVDAELAALSYDSAARPGDPVPAGTRSEAARSEGAVLRALTFASSRLTIELQLDAESVLGQISPPSAGEVHVQPASGHAAVVPVDTVGYFVLRPVPEFPFRLRLHTGDGTDVLTGWVTP